MIRLGICNEMFVDWTLPDVCETVKGLGYEGLELAPFTLATTINDLNSSRRGEIRRAIADSGLATIGLHWLLAKTEGLYLTSPDPLIRRRTADYLCDLAVATRDLGGELMVFGSPKQRNLLPGVSFDSAMGYAEEVFSNLLPTLDATGVTLCLEPLAPTETDFLTTIDQANALIRRLDHPRLQLHMDVKAQSGDPSGTVPDLIRRHAATAAHFHAQDVNLRGPGMGDVDFGPILQALVDSGYDRWVSVEVFDYTPDPVTIATESIACLTRELKHALRDLPKSSA
jgi:sugar phosphate isomerase/epimerase